MRLTVSDNNRPFPGSGGACSVYYTSNQLVAKIGKAFDLKMLAKS